MKNTCYILLLLPWSLAACADPCMDLAKQICACEPTIVKQQSCDLRVEAQAEYRDPTKEQMERCEALKENCTCEKLAAGDMAACGLAP